MNFPVTNHATGEIEFRDTPFIRTRFNYDRDSASIASGLSTPDPTRAQQQFKEETDINTIVKRFGLTGQLPENLKVPVSGDFTETVNDYQSALNMVIAAERAFMQLPGHVRERFSHDPQKLQEFVENKDNLEEARKLGLAVPAPVAPPPPAPMPVRIIADDKTSST